MRRRHEYAEFGFCASCGARTHTGELLARDGRLCLKCWQTAHPKPAGKTRWQLWDEGQRRKRLRRAQWRSAAHAQMQKRPEHVREIRRRTYWKNRDGQLARRRIHYARPEVKARHHMYMSAYYQAHRAEILSKDKAYRQGHLKEHRAYDASYYANHREQRRSSNAKAYQENKEQRLAYRRMYYETHREEILAKEREGRRLKKERERGTDGSVDNPS